MAVTGGLLAALVLRQMLRLEASREALRESEERYRLMAENTGDVIWLLDLYAMRFTYVSPSVERLRGYSPAEVLEQTVSEVLTPTSAELVGRLLPERLARFAAGDDSQRTQTHEVDQVCRNGAVVPTEVVTTLLTDSTGRPTQILGVTRDISERRRADEHAWRWRLVFEKAEFGLALADAASDTFLEVNPTFSRQRGYEPGELVGRPVLEVYPPELHGEVRRRMEDIDRIGHGIFESEQLRRDGTRFPVLMEVTVIRDERGRSSSRVAYALDITEQRRSAEEKRRLEEQLSQSQKLESVGRLAGGVAHDFNNMLSVIAGRAELALLQGLPPGPLRAALEEILKTAERSADLTRQLLTFARKQTINPKVLDPNEAISATLKILRRLIGEDVTLVWKPGHDVWKIRIDPSQLDQILANLAVNARDAIVGQGSLTLETANAALDGSNWPRLPDFVGGDYVVLTVVDTGQGMEREVLDHAFEPFFTTKEPGKGTGLGLATVFGIVRQNGGFIDVESAPGQGTSFRIALPRAGGPGEGAAREDPAPLPVGSETILVAEDEEAILHVVRSLLESAGYEVLAARSPSEALHLAAKHAGTIHLLFTDVVMPGMSGRELAEGVRELRPETKCLYMSGYSEDVIAHRGVLDEGVHFIAKPLRRDDLVSAVRRVLDAEAPAAAQ